MSSTLQVQFCRSTARIQCDDADLSALLTGYFRHCLGQQPFPVVVRYQLTHDETAWYIQRDDQPAYDVPTPTLAYMHVALDVVAKLVNRCSQHTIFHAAGLARDERGIVLCGQSDSGKSTLAAWLTASGFDFMSDEMIALADDSPEITGFTCPLILKKNSTFLWQHWLPDKTRLDFLYALDGAVWIDPEMLRPHSVRPVVIPHLLIFPRYDAQATLTVQPLTSAQATFRLMQRVINFASRTDRGVNAAKNLARQTTAYAVTYRDLHQVTTWLEQTLDQI